MLPPVESITPPPKKIKQSAGESSGRRCRENGSNGSGLIGCVTWLWLQDHIPVMTSLSSVLGIHTKFIRCIYLGTGQIGSIQLLYHLLLTTVCYLCSTLSSTGKRSPYDLHWPAMVLKCKPIVHTAIALMSVGCFFLYLKDKCFVYMWAMLLLYTCLDKSIFAIRSHKGGHLWALNN